MWRLLGLDGIGMSLSDGFADAGAVDGGDNAHHPQAVYFGMKSGFILMKASTS